MLVEFDEVSDSLQMCFTFEERQEVEGENAEDGREAESLQQEFKKLLRSAIGRDVVDECVEEVSEGTANAESVAGIGEDCPQIQVLP